METKSSNFFFSKRIKSFKYALNGFKTLYKNEHNFRIHLFAALLVVIAGFVFQISKTDWIFILVMIGLVIITEIINSAIEYLSDFISPEKNELIGKVKDICASAVLLLAILSIIVGAMIFLPRILKL